MALLATAAITSGCVGEPVAARIENTTSTDRSIEVTVNVSERLKRMLSGDDLFSRAEIFLEEPRTGLTIMPVQTVRDSTGQGPARVMAHFACPLTATGIDGGMVFADEVADLSGYKLVVSWNAHMLIGSRGNLKMDLPNDVACEVGEGSAARS